MPLDAARAGAAAAAWMAIEQSLSLRSERSSRKPLHRSGGVPAVGAAVALTYVIAAELGFQVAFAAEQVTTVWAPTGIAIAALLLRGLRLWPAVWAGAFVANAGSDAALWTAAVVATGNTLEAVAATWALRKLPRFDPGLQRLSDVLAFIGIAAAASTVVSATVGVATLCVAGVQPWGRFAELWFAWWLGDAHRGRGTTEPGHAPSSAARSWRRTSSSVSYWASEAYIRWSTSSFHS